MGTTEFSKFITCLSPLLENSEYKEHFVRRILEIYTPYRTDSPTSEHIPRSDSTLKKYAYGSEDISKSFATYLLKYKDEYSLKEFIEEHDDDITLLIYENIKNEFQIPDLNLQNIAEKVSLLLTDILRNVAKRSNNKKKISLSPDELSTKMLLKNDKLHFMGSEFEIPPSNFTESILSKELKLRYLLALLEAYNDAENCNYSLSELDKLKSKYLKNLREQRVNYFEADSLKRFTRDCIESSEDEFQKLLDETYDGVINTCSKEYKNAYERLLSVLEQSTRIELRASNLFHIPNLITNKRKAGFCHMLVNDNRIQWLEVDEDE